ncbi:hypothetical protein C8R46DRAFT_1027679 [Mycena filopes]|nr:hypothetical protein C8R46DRAFT_1027679 [Mycena filopes]
MQINDRNQWRKSDASDEPWERGVSHSSTVMISMHYPKSLLSVYSRNAGGRFVVAEFNNSRSVVEFGKSGSLQALLADLSTVGTPLFRTASHDPSQTRALSDTLQYYLYSGSTLDSCNACFHPSTQILSTMACTHTAHQHTPHQTICDSAGHFPVRFDSGAPFTFRFGVPYRSEDDNYGTAPTTTSNYPDSLPYLVTDPENDPAPSEASSAVTTRPRLDSFFRPDGTYTRPRLDLYFPGTCDLNHPANVVEKLLGTMRHSH